jgi:cohesin loading factor subunit SCC2
MPSKKLANSSSFSVHLDINTLILSRLRDGRSIRTVSALLLQLVQTSAHDVQTEARKIEKARNQAFAMHKQESFMKQEHDQFLDENDSRV